MNKMELIKNLSKETAISKSEATTVLDIFFNSMGNELAKGGRVEIRGLFSFFIKKYKSYIGRNPKTGEKVKIKPKKLPFFKAGKELKEIVNYLSTNHHNKIEI
jgi:integration host factor subunit beta